jgi:FMN phosphatase YigB (HAD superfamily)
LGTARRCGIWLNSPADYTVQATSGTRDAKRRSGLSPIGRERVDVTTETVILFDVDNTLLDNDRFQEELREHLRLAFGEHARERYWAAFEKLWSEHGYADYLGALERYRLEEPHDPRLLRLGNWLLDYSFADRLYPDALEAVRHARQWGRAVILSDGDAVFQPRKIDRSGLFRAFNGNVLIYVHKEKELRDVERSYPARHYVLIDDKLSILDAVKKIWGDRVTTVFPKQGHYALEAARLANLPPPDIAIERIGDLTKYDLASLKHS